MADTRLGFRQSHTATASHNLMELSATMRDRLPREIRDMIYGLILDVETIKKIYDCAFGTSGGRSTTWPAFITPRAIDETIRDELVELFCKLNTCLEVDSPPYVDHMLNRKLLHTRHSLGEHKLCSLTILLSFIRTSRGYLWKRTELCEQLEDFFQGKQNLADDFLLTLRVQTSCFLVASVFPYDVVEAGIQRMIPCLRDMYSLFLAVKAHVEQGNTKRRVVFAMRAESRGRDQEEVNSGIMTNVDFDVHEKMLTWDGRMWWEYVVPLLRRAEG